jgi:hypothetical protein
MKGKSGDNMKKICVIMVFLLILFSFLSSGCISEEKESSKESSNNDDELNGNYTTMHEFLDDMIEVDDGHVFKSYGEGDEVEIIDIIIQIEYHSDDDVTSLLFKSQESKPLATFFKGDLTSNFEVNDKIIITFHIIKIDMGNGNYMEFPEEAYNSESNETEPSDSDCIKLYE